MTSSFSKQDYKVTQCETLYKGVFRLVRLHLRHRLFNGEWSNEFTREVLERGTAAAVLPYDPIRDRVILIEQFRPGALADPIHPWQIEIPAGMIKINEDPLNVAIRETKEETDCDISDLELIYEYFVSPGGSTEYLHVYCGLVDSQNVGGTHGLPEENEDIRVLNLSTDEAIRMLRNKEIKNAPAIIAIQWLMLNRERLLKAIPHPAKTD